MDIINHLQAYKDEWNDLTAGETDYKRASALSYMTDYVDAFIKKIIELENYRITGKF